MIEKTERQGPGFGRSLRLRLVLVSLMAILGTLVLAHSVLTQLFERHVTAQFQANLRITLDQLAAAIRTEGAPVRLTVREPQGDPRWTQPYSGTYWQINAAEAVLAGGARRSRSLWDYRLQLPGDALSDGAVHVHRIDGPNKQRLMALERTVIVGGEGDGDGLQVRLIAAADLYDLRTAVQEFNRAVIHYLAILAAVLVGVLMVQITVGLAPLLALQGALTRLRAGASEQLEGVFPTEIQPLADSFNGILSEHRRHVERARNLAGNLAHAVKTPLSVMANAAGDLSASTQSLRETVATYTAQARAQVDWHMKRARMAAGVAAHRPSIEIRPVVDGIVAVMQRAYAEKQLQWTVSVPPQGMRFKGESQDLQEMLGNLVDNACKWARQQVSVSTQRTGDGMAIVIEDDGPGVPPEQHQAILGRGVRMDEWVPGSGLGLAIVSELVALYGGRLGFGASGRGGLAVRLILPIEND